MAINARLSGDDSAVIAGVSKFFFIRMQGAKGITESTKLKSKSGEGSCST